MNDIDIRTADPFELADIGEVEVNKELPYKERIDDYIRQIRNPYCYRCKGMAIKISFAGQSSLADCLNEAINAEEQR